MARWDTQVVENGEKIHKLYTSTFEAERASAEIEQQLTGVEAQQAELGDWLDRYERELDELFKRQVAPGDGLQRPDQERERTLVPYLFLCETLPPNHTAPSLLLLFVSSGYASVEGQIA